MIQREVFNFDSDKVKILKCRNPDMNWPMRVKFWLFSFW